MPFPEYVMFVLRKSEPFTGTRYESLDGNSVGIYLDVERNRALTLTVIATHLDYLLDSRNYMTWRKIVVVVRRPM